MQTKLLVQAQWVWTRSIIHDCSVNLKIIVQKRLAQDETRTELEVEVINEWMLQNGPTSIAYLVGQCDTRSEIVAALRR